jgi:hypothetical protein
MLTIQSATACCFQTLSVPFSALNHLTIIPIKNPRKCFDGWEDI